MSTPELPGLPAILVLLGASAPFLALAVRRAGALLPRRAAPDDRWPGFEALAVMGTPFVLLLGLGVFARRGASGEPAEPDVLASLLGTQLVLGAGVVVALLSAARRPRGLASLGLGARVPPGAFRALALVYLPGFLFALGLGGAWAHLCRALGWEERQEILQLILTLEREQMLLAGVVAVLVGPLIEELLFRGFLLSYLAQFMDARAALVVSAALFARLHGMAGLPILFLLSLLLGWLQQRTRCIWVPWGAHALNNALTLGLALGLRPE